MAESVTVAPTGTAEFEVEVVTVGLALFTIRGSQIEFVGLFFESPEYEASSPKDPVELKIIARELGTAPPVVTVTVENIVWPPVHVLLVV